MRTRLAPSSRQIGRPQIAAPRRPGDARSLSVGANVRLISLRDASGRVAFFQKKLRSTAHAKFGGRARRGLMSITNLKPSPLLVRSTLVRSTMVIKGGVPRRRTLTSGRAKPICGSSPTAPTRPTTPDCNKTRLRGALEAWEAAGEEASGQAVSKSLSDSRFSPCRLRRLRYPVRSALRGCRRGR